jgi:hypothetical protein
MVAASVDPLTRWALSVGGFPTSALVTWFLNRIAEGQKRP